MQISEREHETSVGEMRKDREMMADGRRYIIYYTFENDSEMLSETTPDGLKSETEERENV